MPLFGRQMLSKIVGPSLIAERGLFQIARVHCANAWERILNPRNEDIGTFGTNIAAYFNSFAVDAAPGRRRPPCVLIPLLETGHQDSLDGLQVGRVEF
jgi:hypothetical protein